MKLSQVSTKSILSRTTDVSGGFSANPYLGCSHACKYCYASYMVRFSYHTEPWGEFVDVKHWAPILDKFKLKGEPVFMSTVTDPYQPCEEQQQRSRALLKELLGSECQLTIATKSKLVLRDIDLIRQFPDARVAFSINTLDETFRAKMDQASSIQERIDAMRTLHNEGIRTVLFLSPIFPGITDCIAIMDRCKEICDEVWLAVLNLRGSFRKPILDFIKSDYPDLSPLYDEIYNQGDRSYWYNLNVELKNYADAHSFNFVYTDTKTLRPRQPLTIVQSFFHEDRKQTIATAKPPNTIIGVNGGSNIVIERRENPDT